MILVTVQQESGPAHSQPGQSPLARVFRPLSRQVIGNQPKLLQETNRNTAAWVLESPGGGLHASTTGADVRTIT